MIVQSIPDVLALIKKKIDKVFPNLDGRVSYHSNFEQTLLNVPKNNEIVVIASDSYHDEDDFFEGEEKDGNKLAEEIKKINPQAKVYIFSTYAPRLEYVDGFYLKSKGGDNTVAEMIEIFYDLGLNE